MLIYILNIIIVAVLSAYSIKNSSKVSVNSLGEKYIEPNRIFWFIACAFIILVYACRWKTGTDTAGYNMVFYSMGQKNISDVLYGGGDVLFYSIVWLDYHMLSGSLIAHNVIIGIITYLPIIFLYKNYSKNSPMALLLYILTATYYFAFNGQRQAAAVGLCIIAYLFLIKKKYVHMSILVLIAYMIHSTAIIILFIYIIVNRKTTSKFFILSTGVFLFSAIFVRNLWDSLFELLGATGQEHMVSSYYGTSSMYEGSNILRFLVWLTPIAIGIIKYSLISKNNKDYAIILNLNIFGAIFMLAGTYNWLIARLGQYFLPFLPILLIRISDAFDYISRKIYYYIILVLYFIYMYVFVHLDTGLPYYFLNDNYIFR